MEKIIDEILKFDPLAEAEKLTGKDSHNDDDTVWLGMALSWKNNEIKNEALRAINDTVFSMTIGDYLLVVNDIGFKSIIEIPFTDEGRSEKQYIMWHDAGILLNFDTFRGDRNGGHFYYNIKPFNQTGERMFNTNVLSSGSFENINNEWIWAGDHDCREAIKYHIAQLNEYGTFLNPWIKSPYFSLLNYHDWNSISHMKYPQLSIASDEIQKEKLKLLPSKILQSIKITKE